MGFNNHNLSGTGPLKKYYLTATTTKPCNKVRMEEGEVKKVGWRREQGKVEKGNVEEGEGE